MIKLFEKVKIKSKNLIGTIVDIRNSDGKTIFMVESDTPNVEGGYGGEWKLFDCLEEEIEEI